MAALLTIIGFSVNDTIVTFDRLREIKGKTPQLTAKMVNDSVNQTLSRTILTVFTVFIVVFVLYVFGGDGLHSFAFAFLVGVFIGTYSSVYIAAPVLLWLSGVSAAPEPKLETSDTRHAAGAAISRFARIADGAVAAGLFGKLGKVCLASNLFATPHRRRYRPRKTAVQSATCANISTAA